MPSIMHEPDLPFMFLWGGRATGKTYGALLECASWYEKTGDRFIYQRRTDKQLAMCANMNTNPFKPIFILSFIIPPSYQRYSLLEEQYFSF